MLARHLDGSASQVIPNTPGVAHLRLSPDAQFLYSGYGSATMQRMPIAGGAWTWRGVEATSFIASPRTARSGGAPTWASEPIGTADGRDSLVFPGSTIAQILPGDRYAVGLGLTTGSNNGLAQLLDLHTGEVASPRLRPSWRSATRWGTWCTCVPTTSWQSRPSTCGRASRTGAHVEIASDVLVSGIGFAQFAVAENGTVAYIPGSESDLVRVSRDGQVRVLMEERRRYHSPRISPDGRIAFDHVSSDGRDAWIWSETEDLTRATFQRDGHDPVWTRDGKGLYYLAGNGGRLDIFRTQLGSTVQPRAESTGVDLSYTGTHPGMMRDSSRRSREAPGGGWTSCAWCRKATGSTPSSRRPPTRVMVPSPDGRWFAYISDHSGRPEVYLRALSGSDVQLQVSVDGASEPIWSRDGQELFYRRATPMGTELVAAALQLDAEPGC